MASSLELSFAKNRFDRAAAKFAKDKAYLFAPDGSKIYSDAEHNTRLAAITQPLTEAAQNVRQVAEAARASSSAAKSIQYSDPLTTLTDTELGRAFHLRPFIDDSVAAMPLDQLAQRLSAINAGGDKAAIACYSKASGRKIEALRAASRTDPTISLEGISAVVELIGELTGKLVSPKQLAQLEEAVKLEAEANEIDRTVSQMARDLDGSTEQAKEQARTFYQETF